ncbi:MAG: tetratricopeptide repeat protein [Bryobacteraceae bacterium]
MKAVHTVRRFGGVAFLLAGLALLRVELPAAETPESCRALERHGRAAEAGKCFAVLAAMKDPYYGAEGLWGIHDYKTANDSFRAAVASKPKDPHIRVRWGLMFLERFQKADAAALFEEALAIQKDYPPALLGMAKVAAGGFEKKAVEFAEQALKADPKLVEAQELLARLALEDSKPDKAADEAQKALKISPEALDAMAVLASIDWLNDKESPWIGKILAINPIYGEAYATGAHFFDINRRYEESIKAYRKALELDPQLWEAKSELGISLMRLGQEKEARVQLEACYESGFRPALVVNTLRLLDSYKNFTTYRTPRTILRVHKKEDELLKLYFQPELELAIATYEKKYKVKLNAPVQLEVYPDHEDFAVRTLGMPGLGALGVTFGTVVAMDSPAARKPGQWHWASTMWHELSHVYVLTATHHRVPRWFTEGLAVHEETAIHPDWGDRLDAVSIDAIKKKKLLPVADLDRGFVRPDYPLQVQVSYFQAGRICDYINQKWGWDKLLGMMNDYGDRKQTPEVIQHNLGITAAEFDKEFLAWLGVQTKKTVDSFDAWKSGLKVLAEAAKNKQWDDVLKQSGYLRDLYPDYVEAGNIYEFAADAYLAKGDKANATKELASYSKIGGRNPATLKKLAALQVEAGQKKEAAATLERLNYIYPLDEDLHKRLGALAEELGRPMEAVREFRAVVAWKPTDVAGAHFQLAQALKLAKKTDEARDEVLLALEAAPGFKPAQHLLLELSGSKP